MSEAIDHPALLIVWGGTYLLPVAVKYVACEGGTAHQRDQPTNKQRRPCGPCEGNRKSGVTDRRDGQ